MAGPVRCIDRVCEAILQGKFHPDRPPGTEWDTSEVVFEPVWDGHRQPQTTSPVPGEEGDTSSDEACTNDTHNTEDDTAEADWLDAITVTQTKPNNRAKGYIFSRTDLAKTKTPRYHIAVNFDEVPGYIVGCNSKDKRASVMIGNKQQRA